MANPGWHTGATNEALLERAMMLKNIRAFFDARDVVEVETPLLSSASTTDTHLDSLATSFRGRSRFLNTSPEFAMKRLLASWRRPVFQVCKAFRDDELGRYHNPEFSMLEWYQPGYDSVRLMSEVQQLVTALCDSSARFDASAMVHFESISYQQAFETAAGIDPHNVSVEDCVACAQAHGVDVPEGMASSGTAADEVDAWLDWLLTQLVLPGFRTTGFTFLYDYPATQCALARVEVNGDEVSVAKRFELFYGELELANGFDELTDATQQQQRFERENEIRRRSGKASGVIDHHFVEALRHGLPDCAGVAVGLDRLLMVLIGADTIEQVLAFGWDRS